MKSATGRWVVGDDFHGRETELKILKNRIRDGNHILLSGQRRMGKTSIARELGRRLEADGWVSLFADVEHAACPEDVIAELARAAHPVRPIAKRIADSVGRRIRRNVDKISVGEFHVKIRAELDAGNWCRVGDGLFATCADHERPVFLVVDELPVFLSNLLQAPEGKRRVDEFLSWMRRAFQAHETGSFVAILSGSIGLAPLVARLGLSDRINHLSPFRLEPWDRDTSVACFLRLAESYGLDAGEDVSDAVYDELGIGIPHFVQRYFAHLWDLSRMRDSSAVSLADVEETYRTGLLDPPGHGNLMYYEERLRKALDDDTYCIAMEILAEAAVGNVFSPDAQRALERKYAVDDTPERVREALGVLEHDGYLEPGLGGYRFSFRLLRDWWAGRFRGHHAPLAKHNAVRKASR